MKNIALIFAGGAGQRMGAEVPKQFLQVCGKEIIIHTLELFEENDQVDEIYVACIKGWIPFLEKLISKYDIDKVVRIFPGGKTGQDSIFVGLEEVKKDHDDAIVLIHDGVRPLVSQETISNCIDAAHKFGSAVTVTPCYETPIKSVEGDVVTEMPDRRIMYTAQAPQCFHLTDLHALHLAERQVNPDYEGIVDSCGLMFKHGIKSHLVEGNRGNIKVTTQEDFCTLIGNLNARDYRTLLNIGEHKLKLEGEK